MNKKVIIFGGGTFSYIRNHLALSAPAFGTAAKQMYEIAKKRFPNLDVELKLTKMADSNSNIITNEDLKQEIDSCVNSNLTKVIILNTAVCDFDGQIKENGKKTSSGKYNERLSSSKEYEVVLTPKEKIVSSIRKNRKDIFLVAFKTTCGLSTDLQYIRGIEFLKKTSCNLVVCNDVLTHTNMIITPEEARYHVTKNRNELFENLMEIVFYRSHLSFTQSTVVDGQPVNWNSDEVPSSLRAVVDYCIEKNAYKPLNGVTVGHFACKLSDNEFLTSIRKTNFNDLSKNGLVRVKTDGPDTVIAFGAKPSVGGQSQRIVFKDHPGFDCIVHFHCPIKPNSLVPIASQRLVECGSHQCGKNTSDNLMQFGNLKAVYLDNHGPNIIFNKNIDPQEVINFIEDNFDLSQKTGGFVSVNDLFSNSNERDVNV